MKWFGRSWNAPICKPEDKVPTPKGQVCMFCDREIKYLDQGVMLPFHDIHEYKLVPYHIDCLIMSIGLKK